MSSAQLFPGFAIVSDSSPDPDAVSGDASIPLFYAVPNPTAASSSFSIFWRTLGVAEVQITGPGYDSGVLVNPGGVAAWDGNLTVSGGVTTATTFTLNALDGSGNPIVINGPLTAPLTVSVS